MALRVLVTSDTHTKAFNDLPQPLRDELTLADVAIHAGDFGTERFYTEFAAHSNKLYAVRGNNDFMPLPKELTFSLEELSIGLVHSDAAHGDRTNWLLYYFPENPRLIIYGHTHRPIWLESGEYTLLNPGSPTRNRGMGYNSFAVLTIDGRNFDIKFQRL